MAPELNGSGFDEAADVYACGVIICKLILVLQDKRMVTHLEVEALLKMIDTNKLMRNIEITYLVEKMLDPKPEARPKLPFLIKNKWLCGLLSRSHSK